MEKRSLNCFLLLSFLWMSSFGQVPKQDYLTRDGAWCWFSDPRAIMVNGKVIAGWVKSNGTVEAVQFDPESGDVHYDDLYFRLEYDDHDNPAFVTTADGKVLAMYTRHSLRDLFINILDDQQSDFDFGGARLIHPVSRDELEKFPRNTITYANPIRLEEENGRIYCFGRWTGYKPNMMWSNDQGDTWTTSKVFITNVPFDPNNRPYVKYFSNGQSSIHMVFTDGHPRVEPTNSVYYVRYEKGHFLKADGQRISDMSSIPFEPKDSDIIYRSNERDGRAWIADIGADEQGNPVILYTRSPEETDHRYWYARFDGAQWHNHEICKAGSWFPQTPVGETEREPHYFGGMSIHPGKANVIYLSREIDGVFEIERWETSDSGESWKVEKVTGNSTYDNVRPFIPRGLQADEPEIVLWMENELYIHYTQYKSSIRYHVRP